MINYEYQVLRYIPDQVSGEFLNVGLVILCQDENTFRFDCVSTSQRISSTFHGIPSRHIIRKLKSISNALKKIRNKDDGKLLLDQFSTVDQLTKSILQKDDSALQFTEIKKGIDISIDAAFNDLRERLLYKWFQEQDKKYLSDEDIWREKYRIYFEKRGLMESLQSFTAKTEKDEFSFNYSIKNGKWHCFQPINFNLKKEESIRNKVYRWKGILAELESSDEPLRVIFLPELPKNKMNVSRLIQEQLQTNGSSKVSAKMATIKEISNLLEDIVSN